MKTNGVFGMAIIAILAVGCASSRQYSRVSSTFPPIPSGDGRIILYRANEFYGSGQWDTVWLDGKTVGDLSSDSFFYLDEPTGSYTVSARPKGLLIFKIRGQWKQLPITLDAGETKYIILKQDFNMVVAVPEPVLKDVDSAMKDLPSCLYYAGKYHAL